MATDSIKLEIRGIAEVKRKFELLAKNAPALASKSINAAAGSMRDALIGSTFKAFNTPPGSGPSPFTIRAFDVSYATPNKLYAEVGLKKYIPGGKALKYEGREHYLAPQVFGGGRPKKLGEYTLGGYYVPGAAAKLNQYGNIAEINKILAGLGLKEDKASNTDINRTKGTRRGLRRYQKGRRVYWFGRVGKKQTLGVWAVGEGRGNERIRPVLIFPDQGRKIPRYKKRWPFFEIARKEYARVLPGFVAKYFKQWIKGS
jgi:hypothetical protein